VETWGFSGAPRFTLMANAKEIGFTNFQSLDCCSSKQGDTLQHELMLHVLGEVTMVISQPNG